MQNNTIFNMKINKAFIILSFLISLFYGCSEPEEILKEGPVKKVPFYNAVFLPSEEIQKQEEVKKKALVPEAFEAAWVVSEIENSMNYFNFNFLTLNDIPERYRNAIKVDIDTKVFKRMTDFETVKNDKYADIKCSITYENIKKGDVLLTVTRNPVVMAMDSEDSFHHALLCVKDPVSNDDPVFITCNGEIKMSVDLYSLSQTREYEDFAVVLRLHNPDEYLINKVVSFAESQLHKPYNLDFIEKRKTDSYYCSQLVWRSYYEAGLNIDDNDFLYNDYGLVLSSDIYQSPYFYIVKYSD